jgi:hypothetical protein
MKKTFPFEVPGKARARVVDAVKHDLRRYVQRERRKPLPEGFSRWNFECAAGADPSSARPCALVDLGRMVDEVANTPATHVYVEIQALPGQREGSTADDAS